MKNLYLYPKHIVHKIKHSYIFIGLASLCWLLFKSGPKPSRIQYPCQRAAAANVSIFLMPLLFVYFHVFRRFFSTERNRKALLLLAAVICGSWSIWQGTQWFESSQQQFKAKERVQAGAMGISLSGLSSVGTPLFEVIPHASKLPSPHRVVAVHDSDATSWDFPCRSSGECPEYYGAVKYVDQQVVDQMVASGVMRLTGTTTAQAAWLALLPDYQPGEKIAIK